MRQIWHYTFKGHPGVVYSARQYLHVNWKYQSHSIDINQYLGEPNFICVYVLHILISDSELPWRYRRLDIINICCDTSTSTCTWSETLMMWPNYDATLPIDPFLKPNTLMVSQKIFFVMLAYILCSLGAQNISTSHSPPPFTISVIDPLPDTLTVRSPNRSSVVNHNCSVLPQGENPHCRSPHFIWN